MNNLSKWIIGFLFFGIFGCLDTPDTLFIEQKRTGIDFRNDLHESDSFNIIQYLYYYNGGGVAAGDLNNDGLPDLYFTANEEADRLYLNKGDFKFKDITREAGIGNRTEWSNGVTMADVNGDGWLDIYVCQLGDYKGKKGRNRLYINNGDLTFKESAAAYGLDFKGFSTHSAFFDYDLDGDLDVFLLNHSVHSAENFGRAAGIRPRRDQLAGDRLMRNDNGRFRDVSMQAGIYGSKIGYGLGIGVSDLNHDGFPDLYVSNDFHENDYLYLNNGDGTFTESLKKSVTYTSQFSMGNNIADLNNDGWTDMLTLDMKPEAEPILKSTVGAESYDIHQLKNKFGYHHQYPRNMLQLNRGVSGNGKTYFSEVGQLAGIAATDWSWSVLANDLDNDGWKDVFISNGIWRRPNDLDYLKYTSNQEIQQSASDLELAGKMPGGKVSNYAFRNQGGWMFENVTEGWGLGLLGCSTGAALSDLDLDGDADLILNNINVPATIYKNQAIPQLPHNYLKISLKGNSPNTSGIGARVVVKAGERQYVQELFPSRGYLSASEPVLLFGLGENAIVEEVRVEWPGGEQTIEKSVEVNQTLLIEQKKIREDFDEEVSEMLNGQILKAVADGAGLNFIHRENTFNDFHQERLLLHKLSTQGPKIAVGDVNGDGWDDMYICGAKGQNGMLYIQEKGSDFEPLESSVMINADSEETAAVFVDIDGDKDLDLYLVHGGGEYNGNIEVLQDQLLLNDGVGNFSLSKNGLPEFFANGSCVVPLDFDKDGDFDLFVGTRSLPGSYGLDPQSYLLQNNGKGKFEDVTSTYLPNEGKLGMITDAALLKENGAEKLVLVGEWLPVLILTIGDDLWEKSAILNSTGWWNAIELADLNGDGAQDLVLGNLGWNADLKASVQEPVSLYVKDFDDNLKTDPILTHFKGGKEYIYHSIDELIGQLVGIRKDFHDYSTFANLTFPDIFTEEELVSSVRKRAVTFASSIALNQGDGAFDLKPMPLAAQISPVFGLSTYDVDDDGNLDILVGGNISGVQPGLGMYSASLGTLLRGDASGDLSAVHPSESGWLLEGEVRDIKVVESTQGALVVVARNNNTPLVFQIILNKKEF